MLATHDKTMLSAGLVMRTLVGAFALYLPHVLLLMRCYQNASKIKVDGAWYKTLTKLLKGCFSCSHIDRLQLLTCMRCA